MRSPNGCAHRKFTRGLFYDSCDRCGGTRRTARDGKPAGPWHVCPLCVHYPALAETHADNATEGKGA